MLELWGWLTFIRQNIGRVRYYLVHVPNIKQDRGEAGCAVAAARSIVLTVTETPLGSGASNEGPHHMKVCNHGEGPLSHLRHYAKRVG